MLYRDGLVALVLLFFPVNAAAHEVSAGLLASPVAYHQADTFSTNHEDYKGTTPLGFALGYEYRLHRYVSLGLEAQYFRFIPAKIDGFDLPIIVRGILPLAADKIELWVEAGFGVSFRVVDMSYRYASTEYGFGWTVHAGGGIRYRLTRQWAVSFRAAVHFARHEVGDRHVDNATFYPMFSLMLPSLVVAGSYRF